MQNKVIKKRMLWLLLGVLSLIVVGMFDFQTGHRISLMPFYLIPVVMAAFVFNWRGGLIMSGISSLVWLLADINVAGNSDQHLFTSYWNASVRMFFFFAVVVGIELWRLLKEEKQESRIDPLTGISNRRSFYEMARQEIDRCRRYGHPFSLVFFDCNGFKKVNDKFGHDAGDKVLRKLAEQVRLNVRGCDVAARWGGDEFVVLLPETDRAGSVRFVNRLNRAFVTALAREPFSVTASFGAKTYTEPPASIDDMVRETDARMYGNKKNRIVSI